MLPMPQCINIGHPKSFREKVMFAWYTRKVVLFFLFHEAEKQKCGDLARGANRVNFVIFPFPLRVTHLMVRLQLP